MWNVYSGWIPPPMGFVPPVIAYHQYNCFHQIHPMLGMFTHHLAVVTLLAAQFVV